MNIRLPRPPTASSAPRFAEDVASWVRVRFALDLDFSVESLVKVDALLETMRQERVPLDDKVGETLWCLGCYVGEVFVRNTNAEWTDREELPPVIACGETRINPIGKVVKRVALDDRGDLTAFYAQFIAS
jgi:hypothetical protein